MKAWRCGILLVERRDAPADPLRAMLSVRGDRGGWVALAPHLDAEIVVDLADLALLEDARPARAEAGARSDLEATHGVARVAQLLASGLLLCDDTGDARHALHAARDDALRAVPWWPVAAAAQRFGRWDGVDGPAQTPDGGHVARILAQHGLPPPAHLPRGDAARAIVLPSALPTDFDALLSARSTCRNFSAAGVTLQDLAVVLGRALGAQAARDFHPGATVFKKHSPSGGGLHPVDGYVLARRVEGLAPGRYHYDPAGLLRPIDGDGFDAAEGDGRLDAALADSDFAGAALRLVAGQQWFADAPVLVLLAARFDRSFWKYRRHAKAWKVVQLDAGHVSQTFLLAATERGFGAFITAAIDDAMAERLFGLDGLATGAVAVCGFGPRDPVETTLEFDPLGKAVR
jgi:putative peptide maturation dehydrogenase